MQIKLEHLLIGIIVLFGLHLVMNRCSCNLNNGFRVGIPVSSVEQEYQNLMETYEELFVDYIMNTTHIDTDVSEETYQSRNYQQLLSLQGDHHMKDRIPVLTRYIESLRGIMSSTEEELSSISLAQRFGRGKYTKPE